MRRWLALACVATVCSCGSPTAPTPDFVGSYSFVIEASSVCEMPVERFAWNLVATPAGGPTDQGGSFRMTLPGGDPTLSLNLVYVQRQGRRGQQQGDPTFTITLNAQGVPFGDLQVNINGSTRGTATAAGDGRGQVLDGAINGTIRLSEPAPRGRTEVGSCTAGDHHFTLIPR